MTAPALADYARYAQRRARSDPPFGEAPSVSIVTVTLNAAATLARTIRSVQAQSYPSVEQIFVDGGSTDGTLELIRHHARAQDYWLSEKDAGIADAFNKGAALARGRYLQFLNADDWLSPDQVARSVAALEASGADFVFGDLIFYEDGAPSFTYAGDPSYARVIHRRMPTVGHPTVLARRACFEQIGLFDTLYRNAMDFDWLLRMHRAGGRGVHCPEAVGHMTHDGVSNNQFARTIGEVRDIVIAHGRSPLLAHAEARFRYAKTAISQPIKRHMRPVYRFARSLINPAYRPAATNR